jgi:hypothetical protein
MFAICVLVALVTASSGTQNPPLSAATIMARVAANQDRSNKLRADYVYHQRIHVASRKTNGKLMCEETTDYLVTPAPQGTKRELQRVAGRYRHKGRYVNFDHRLRQVDGRDLNIGWPADASIDCQVADQLGNNLTDDKSKDGIAHDLFPLTTQEQKKYEFQLIGEETLEGRKVYRVSFKPKDKKDFDWIGEADIDAQDFEPVDVYTKLSRRIPLPIRALVIALPGVGFNVEYKPQPEGVWFPASFGTEFRLRLFVFYRREYTVSLENTGFQHTHVTSKMRYIGRAGTPK